ncbi:hypothetical protein [Cytobacillus oceanisediminis]|uniref:hypothetical protein n=1 Tax=Cytobacillus oceanisediminis TaxID=665099 RepID=UPI001FB51F46|nr:hypothetical protein [Cytobacillus oceanisediminis]UOE58079.1 hypothetical protein IRB79_27845 [Cytobacillus oceanisediminis]
MEDYNLNINHVENFNLNINHANDFTDIMKRIAENYKRSSEERIKWSRDVHDWATKQWGIYEELIEKEFGEPLLVDVFETVDIKDKKERELLDCEKFIDNQINVHFPGEKKPMMLTNGYRVLSANDKFPTSITISKETKTAKKLCEYYGLPNLRYFTTVIWDDYCKRPKEVIVVKEPFELFKAIKYNPDFEYFERETSRSHFISIPVDQKAMQDLIVLRKELIEENKIYVEH